MGKHARDTIPNQGSAGMLLPAVPDQLLDLIVLPILLQYAHTNLCTASLPNCNRIAPPKPVSDPQQTNILHLSQAATLRIAALEHPSPHALTCNDCMNALLDKPALLPPLSQDVKHVLGCLPGQNACAAAASIHCAYPVQSQDLSKCPQPKQLFPALENITVHASNEPAHHWHQV